MHYFIALNLENKTHLSASCEFFAGLTKLGTVQIAIIVTLSELINVCWLHMNTRQIWCKKRLSFCITIRRFLKLVSDRTGVILVDGLSPTIGDSITLPNRSSHTSCLCSSLVTHNVVGLKRIG